jgi:LysR family nitrogen assimilation transcriptional regulator
MDVRQLEYFVQIATLGGFNRASAQLYIAQSALSRQVKLLEEELGVTLLIRHKRGTELTAAGSLLLDRSEVLLRNFRQIRDDVIAEGGVPRGELAIGLPASLQAVLAVPLITKMNSLYPLVFLRTWVAPSMELKESLLSGAIDFAVLASFLPEPALRSESLFQDEMMLVGALDAPMPKGEIIEYEEMVDYPLIVTSRPNSLRLLVDEAAAKIEKKLNVIMEMNYLPTLVDLVASGVGYSLWCCQSNGCCQANANLSLH